MLSLSTAFLIEVQWHWLTRSSHSALIVLSLSGGHLFSGKLLTKEVGFDPLPAIRVVYAELAVACKILAEAASHAGQPEVGLSTELSQLCYLWNMHHKIDLSFCTNRHQLYDYTHIYLILFPSPVDIADPAMWGVHVARDWQHAVWSRWLKEIYLLWLGSVKYHNRCIVFFVVNLVYCKVFLSSTTHIYIDRVCSSRSSEVVCYE